MERTGHVEIFTSEEALFNLITMYINCCTKLQYIGMIHGLIDVASVIFTRLFRANYFRFLCPFYTKS